MVCRNSMFSATLAATQNPGILSYESDECWRVSINKSIVVENFAFYS